MQRLSPAPLRPNELLAEVHHAQETEANLASLDLELVVEPDLPELVADREVLRQALQNLVSNAVQALPSRSGRVVLRGRRDDGFVVLSRSRMTGPGIPPENREKVFDLYFTTKEGGTGVGLALVRQAAEMHRGEVRLVSTPGEGTVVTLGCRSESPHSSCRGMMEPNRRSVDRVRVSSAQIGGRLRRLEIQGCRLIWASCLSSGGCSVMRVLYAPELTEHKSITLTVKRDTTIVAVAGAPAIPPAEVKSDRSCPHRSPRTRASSPLRVPSRRRTHRPRVRKKNRSSRYSSPSPSPPPSVSIAMPEEQRARLERLTRAELGMADRITTEIAPRLKSDADLEKLQTVKGLIEQSHAALDRDDIQSAANLAHKAKLLATELLSR